MPWGEFSNIHLATLALAVVINIVIYLILKRKSRSKQIISLFLLSLLGVGGIVYSLMSSGDNIIRNLPLSFWAISALLLPVAVFTRIKKLCNLLLIWSAGSILALVFNANMAHLDISSIEFATFYIMHVLCAGIPILLFELNLVKRDTKTVKHTVISTLFVYTAVHITNLVINSVNGWSVSEGVNYMATLEPNSALLNFFYALIPGAYWYMILTLPILALYIVYWYLPELLDQRRRRKPLRDKLDSIEEYYDELEDEYIDEIIDEKYD